MSDLSWYFYWADVIGSFSFVVGGVLIILFPSAIVFWISFGISSVDPECEDLRPAWKGLAVYSSVVLLVLTPALIFTPSPETLYKMAGITVAENVVNSDEFKELSDKGLKLANKVLDDQLEGSD